MIPYGRQEITSADIEAVTAVLRSDWLTQGPAVPAFEQAVANRCGAVHAVAVNSATSALHIACLALGVGPGDRVWTSPISFVASANCALYCGASIDFVDIDPGTANMSVEALEQKLRTAKAVNALPKVVIPVHYAGDPCDMAAIQGLSREFGFRVIEDAAHAIGGSLDDSIIGGCRHGDVTVFSFHPVKIVTTGEGGMALCNDSQVAARMRLLRNHGITRDSQEMQRRSEGPWYYEQHVLGYNYRMTDIQAALGLSQLERLDAYVERRQGLANRYDEILSDLPVRTLRRNLHGRSAVHLYPVGVDGDAANGAGRSEVFAKLRSAGIGVNVHYIPIHLQPYFRGFGFGAGMFPAAEAFYREALTLPLFPGLAESAQDQIAEALGQALLG